MVDGLFPPDVVSTMRDISNASMTHSADIVGDTIADDEHGGGVKTPEVRQVGVPCRFSGLTSEEKAEIGSTVLDTLWWVTFDADIKIAPDERIIVDGRTMHLEQDFTGRSNQAMSKYIFREVKSDG